MLISELRARWPHYVMLFLLIILWGIAMMPKAKCKHYNTPVGKVQHCLVRR